MNRRAAASALGAAVLFGVSTPLAKLLVGDMPPLLLAGLLYLGSGVGLGALLFMRGRVVGRATPGPGWSVARRDMPWLLGAIVSGGMAAPALLMAGLALSSAASVSLLMNLESVLSALIAWWVFKEHTDRRNVAGMSAIVAGGVLLAWEPGGTVLSPGALLVAAACLCWAIDNNLTRKVSANDAMVLACLKGLVAGACNTGLAMAAGATLPAPTALGSALVVGFAGYGVSLALFVLALRSLGTARTGAYFSVAPLAGVALSLALWPAMPGVAFWAALGLMTVGVGLHLTERHGHEHVHEATMHTHLHAHDEHHAHAHDPAAPGTEPHTHPHAHARLRHAHPHYPDVHHRHPH